MQDEITRFTLGNGLRVVHRRDSATAMVAVTVLYDVGARDEQPRLTGIAHLFEHLMFGGSLHAPDFDGSLSAAGGISNAWTSNDFTCFYDILPAVNIDTALWLESDRMLSPAFTPEGLKVQKSVVIEEFKQTCLNRPYGDMDHLLRRMAWHRHPYRYPVIGRSFSHIERVTLDDVRLWHQAHYAPNNAVLAVCGNISASSLRRKVERWFGDIPPRPIAPRSLPAEPLPRKPRFAEGSGRVPDTVIQMAWPMAVYGQPGYYEADIITDVLANGRASRFYRHLLLDTNLFSEIDASIFGCEDPGLLLINARLNHSGASSEAAAVEAINEQLHRLVYEPVEQRELQRCINRLESSQTFSRVNYEAFSRLLAMAEMHHQDPGRLMEPYRAITPDSLRHTARQIFQPSRCFTLTYRKQD